MVILIIRLYIYLIIWECVGCYLELFYNIFFLFFKVIYFRIENVERNLSLNMMENNFLKI